MFENMYSYLDEVRLVQQGGEDSQERFVQETFYPPYSAVQYNNQELKTRYGLRDKNALKIKRIAIYGCGGHARSIINTLREIDSNLEIVLVDKNAQNNEIILGCRAERQYELRKDDGYIIGIGDNIERKKIYESLINTAPGCCVSVVSLYSRIGLEFQIGVGTFIASNVYIGPQVKIGDNSILNTGSVIEHETRIGNNTHIAPGAVVCGKAMIGNNVFCGAGSKIIDKIHICDNAVIGAGSVVVQDILRPGVYVGVPAKKTK